MGLYSAHSGFSLLLLPSFLLLPPVWNLHRLQFLSRKNLLQHGFSMGHISIRKYPSTLAWVLCGLQGIYAPLWGTSSSNNFGVPFAISHFLFPHPLPVWHFLSFLSMFPQRCHKLRQLGQLWPALGLLPNHLELAVSSKGQPLHSSHRGHCRNPPTCSPQILATYTRCKIKLCKWMFCIRKCWSMMISVRKALRHCNTPLTMLFITANTIRRQYYR